MKNLTFILSAAFVFLATSAFSQQTEAPKTGAKIHIDETKVTVAPNGETTLDVYIVRSKKAGKTTFEAPQFVGAEGATFDVAQDASNPDHYIVTVKGNTSGKYIYTVKSKSNSGTQTISGTTLSVSVGASSVASRDNE